MIVNFSPGEKVYDQSGFRGELVRLEGGKYTNKSLPGYDERGMKARLREWADHASQGACRIWLSLYRLVAGGVDGNSSIYTLSRQDLRRWYYVEQLSPTEIQLKYLREHGVYSDRKHMET